MGNEALNVESYGFYYLAFFLSKGFVFYKSFFVIWFFIGFVLEIEEMLFGLVFKEKF